MGLWIFDYRFMGFVFIGLWFLGYWVLFSFWFMDFEFTDFWLMFLWVWNYGFSAYPLCKISNWIGEFKVECSSNDGLLEYRYSDLGWWVFPQCSVVLNRFLVELKWVSAIFIKNWAVTIILSKKSHCASFGILRQYNMYIFHSKLSINYLYYDTNKLTY